MKVVERSAEFFKLVSGCEPESVPSSENLHAGISVPLVESGSVQELVGEAERPEELPGTGMGPQVRVLGWPIG